MELKDEVTKKVGEKVVKQNPFITSQTFLQLMKAMAVLPKTILVASRGPAEAMNGIQSVVVTFLKNVPDIVWDKFRENMSDDHPAARMFNLMDAIRAYPGDKNHKYVEITEEDDEEMPDINAPMPDKPC